MATTIDYALMAGASYISTRTDINKFPVPQGWTSVIDPPHFKDDATGFEAIAFQKGSEIVISYAGTYDKDIGGDIVADAGLATGVGSAQLLQAVEYYLQIKAANPGTTTTLTGHSLGGGLASLVGVFFGVNATTFDQAPFAQTAMFQANNLKTYLTGKVDGNGARIYSDDLLLPLTSYIGQQEAFGASPTLIPNAGLISNINVQGEFLSGGVWQLPNRIGTTTEDIGNNAPAVEAGDLHAQVLLAAFLLSRQTAPSSEQTLNKVTYKLTDLMKMVFDPKLFAHRTDEANDEAHKSFIDHLVRHEVGMGTSLPADRMLTRFTADLWKLAQEGGLTMTDGNVQNPDLHQVSNALIAFATQAYYEDGEIARNKAKELFAKLDNGGIQFDVTDVAVALKKAIGTGDPFKLEKEVKGFALYFKQYLLSEAFNDQERALVNGFLPWLRDWYVQAGTDGLTASDTQNRGAFLLGGKDSDILTGGEKADLLVGNAGDDRLKGGKGNDLLLGGLGNDVYEYSKGDGLDTVLDKDGVGRIEIDGKAVTGGGEYGDKRVHRDADKRLYVQVDANTMIIDGNIIVKNYDSDDAAGSLGITMKAAPAQTNPATSTTIIGDIKPTDGNPALEGIQADEDQYGNPVGTSQPYGDILHGSSGNDHILGGELTDDLLGGAGDDWLEGGSGNDLMCGESWQNPNAGGNDLMEGGAGSDILYGETGNDRLYGNVKIDTATAIANGNEQKGNYILLRSTPKKPEKFILAFNSYRQVTAANDHVAGLERSAA